MLIDQTRNFERFVKDFHLSNEIKNRLNNLQLQFTFKTTDTIEKIENLKKAVLKYGVASVIDFIHFQYLVNEKYHYDLYESNLKIIKETNLQNLNLMQIYLLKKVLKKMQI